MLASNNDSHHGSDPQRRSMDDGNVNQETPVTEKKKSIMGVILIVTSICSYSLCDGTLYALMAPFLPAEAESKGLSPTQYGFIFAAFPFGQLVFYPITGRYTVPFFGARKSILIGMTVMAITTIAFASVTWCPPGWTFFALTLVLRFLTAVGTTASETAALTLIISLYPDTIMTVFAVREAFFLTGMIIGPGIGGFLFDKMGFEAPFLCVGCFAFACLILAIIVIPNKNADTMDNTAGDIPEASEEPVPLLSLISKFGIVMNLMIVVLAFINVGYTDATLAHHLGQLHLGATTIGGIFLISAVVQLPMAQVWGFVIQRFRNDEAYTVTALVLSVATFILSGPMYPIEAAASVNLTIFRQMFFGFSLGPLIMCPLAAGLDETHRYGFPPGLRTTSAFSGLYHTTFALGATIGAPLGGLLIDTIGYEKGSCVLASFQVVMIIVVVSFYISRRKSGLNSDSCGGSAPLS